MPSRLSANCTLLLLALSVSSLIACGTLFSARELPEFPLLPPAEFTSNWQQGNLQFTEQVTMRHEGEEQVMLAAWVVNQQEINLVGLTPSGQRLMTLRFDGKVFSEEYSPLVREPIPGRQVLSHLQLAQWPLDSVKQALQNTPWRLEASGASRLFYLGDTLVMTSTRDTSAELITVHSPLMNYELQARKLQTD